MSLEAWEQRLRHAILDARLGERVRADLIACVAEIDRSRAAEADLASYKACVAAADVMRVNYDCYKYITQAMLDAYDAARAAIAPPAAKGEEG